MSTADPTTHELRTALSLCAPHDPLTLSRRRFLQAAAAGVGVGMLPSWIADAAGASTGSAGSTSGGGTLVLVVLDGGSDGLHMVPPVAAGAYQDARGDLALGEAEALGIGGGRGFHPALTRLKARYDAGDVAVIDGVGNARRDLSHFSAMADFQHGGPAAQFSRTGWIGRYLDLSSGGPFDAIAIGNRIPLVAHGATRSAITLPWKLEHVPARRSWAAPMDDAVDGWSQVSPGLGPLADRLTEATSATMPSSDVLLPSYPSGFTGNQLAGELQLCANLINAGLGTRVLTVRHGPYDSHTNQAEMLGARMAELDQAIELFFQTLAGAAAGEVTLVCISEFGRRVAANGGFGTDHGAGNSMLAVGPRVAGGVHGVLPSLTSLTVDGNLTHDVDYRSVFATILDGVLGVDHTSVLGSRFELVPFLETVAPPPDSPPPRSRSPRVGPAPELPTSEATTPWPMRPHRWTRTGGDAGSFADGTVSSAADDDARRMYRALADLGRSSEAAAAENAETVRWMSSTRRFHFRGLTR